ncbi:MAG: ArnT family glycosyltransferase [Anaerolineae bacterium]
MTQGRQWRSCILILAFLLIGAALRLIAPGDIPPGLYHDEAQHGLDAVHVLESGDLPLYFAANNGREPLFIYLVTASVALLGRSPLAVRLPSFFVGVLTLAATYDLARVLFGRGVGRWALGVLAVTFWHVHLSRVGFRAVLLPLVTALWMAQAARAVKTKRARHWIAAGALYGLCWYTYMAARFTPVALAAFVGYALLFHRERTLQRWRGAVLFCVAALLILTPLGLYTLRHPDVILARTGQVSVFSETINQGNLWSTLARHVFRTMEMFFARGDRIWRHNLAWRPVWGPPLGLAFVVGVVVTIAGFRRDARAALLLLWTAVMALPTLLAEDAPHFLRAVGVLPTAALLPACGLRWMEKQIEHDKFKVIKWGGLPLALVLLGGLHTTYDYFVRYAQAPLAYHWFEAGPEALAGEINARRGTGWDGQRMLHGPATGRVIYVDAVIWDEWASLPFLVPETSVRFLPVEETLSPDAGLVFVVWPYDDWAAEIWPYVPHPAYLRAAPGPLAQGDKDPQPFITSYILQADPRPEVPADVAPFGNEKPQAVLRAALVRQASGGATVRLWWDARAAFDAPYIVFVHYLRDGEQIAQHDSQPGQGLLPTTRWQPGDLILDEHPLPDIKPDPARDQLRVGLYQSETGEHLPLLDARYQPVAEWVELPVILAE